MCGKIWSFADLELEDHRVVVRGLDAVEVVQQARRAVRVGDLDVAVERELDVGGVEVVAVGPLEAPGLSVTVYSVGEVNSADSARSGTTSVLL